jgi:hypothetical protein
MLRFLFSVAEVERPVDLSIYLHQIYVAVVSVSSMLYTPRYHASNLRSRLDGLRVPCSVSIVLKWRASTCRIRGSSVRHHAQIRRSPHKSPSYSQDTCIGPTGSCLLLSLILLERSFP